MTENPNLSNPLEEKRESKEKVEIVKIPKMVNGSLSDKPGEAGFISWTTNPNF